MEKKYSYDDIETPTYHALPLHFRVPLIITRLNITILDITFLTGGTIFHIAFFDVAFLNITFLNLVGVLIQAALWISNIFHRSPLGAITHTEEPCPQLSVVDKFLELFGLRDIFVGKSSEL